jgi:branched-chain amino acid transport system substrate-binding protein
MRRTLMSTAVLFMVAIALSFSPKGAWGADSPAKAQPYKIGVILDFTGAYANHNRTCYQAIEMAAAEINAQGGILGRPIELLPRDAKIKVDVATREARGLVLRDKVDAMIAANASHTLLAIAEITKEFGVLHLVPISNTESATLYKIHPYLFQVVPNTYMEVSAVASVVSKLGYKTYSTIAADYEWGHSSVEIIKELLPKRAPNMKFIKSYFPPVGETDYTSYITALLADKPEVVMNWISGADLQNFMKQAKGYDFFQKTNFVVFMHGDDLIELGEQVPEGLLIYARGDWWALNNPAAKKFTEKFRSKMGKFPSCWAFLGHDCVTILADAIKAAGTFDKDTVARKLESMTFHTLRGDLSFRDIDHQMNSPEGFGRTVWSPEYGHCLVKDVILVPGEENYRPVEEVLKLRAEKNVKFTPWSQRK